MHVAVFVFTWARCCAAGETQLLELTGCVIVLFQELNKVCGSDLGALGLKDFAAGLRSRLVDLQEPCVPIQPPPSKVKIFAAPLGSVLLVLSKGG